MISSREYGVSFKSEREAKEALAKLQKIIDNCGIATVKDLLDISGCEPPEFYNDSRPSDMFPEKYGWYDSDLILLSRVKVSYMDGMNYYIWLPHAVLVNDYDFNKYKERLAQYV